MSKKFISVITFAACLSFAALNQVRAEAGKKVNCNIYHDLHLCNANESCTWHVFPPTCAGGDPTLLCYELQTKEACEAKAGCFFNDPNPPWAECRSK